MKQIGYSDLKLGQIYKVKRVRHRVEYDYMIPLYEEEDINNKGRFITYGVCFDFNPNYSGKPIVDTTSFYESYTNCSAEIVSNSSFTKMYKYVILKDILESDYQKRIKGYGEGYPEHLNNLLHMMCDVMSN